MEQVREQSYIARRALSKLEEISGRSSVTALERDASIHRFEYTFETVWRVARAYLNSTKALESDTPNGIVRASVKSGLVDEQTSQCLLTMAEDRNMTPRAYDENLAKQIYSRLASHAALMRTWLDEIVKRIE